MRPDTCVDVVPERCSRPRNRVTPESPASPRGRSAPDRTDERMTVDPFSFAPLAALLDLTCSGLMALTSFFTPVAGSAAATVAIVTVTLFVRAVLIPTGIAQARAEQTRARLAPRLRELQRRHRTDPERLQRETMRVYREEGASPFAGCLPLLVQAPVVGLIYAVFLHPTIAGEANPLLTETFAGVPLGSSLLGTVAAGGADATTWLVFGGLVLAIALVAEVTRRVFRPAPAPSGSESGGLRIAPEMLGILHFATAVVAVVVPLAAGVYLLVTAAWTLAQRVVLRRRFPLPSADH